MGTRLAINGFGRIGRCVLRAWQERAASMDLSLVAINEPASARTVAHLLRYDSTHGRYPGTVRLAGEALEVDGHRIGLSHETELTAMPWREAGVDVVLECSGCFADRASAERHRQQGARRVVFSQPADVDVDATVVFGVNEGSLRASHTIISTASCTSNAIIPVIQVLDDAFGIEWGLTTTIHSMMNDQPVIDAYHHTDLRKTRGASQSMIPVDTGLADGIGRVLPSLTGRFAAQALRVPVPNVSAMDLTVQLQYPVTGADVNRVLADAAGGHLAGVLGYTEEPLASCDFNHDPHSGIVDAGQTRVSGRHLAKVLVWFDNEWAYAHRMLDTVRYWAELEH